MHRSVPIVLGVFILIALAPSSASAATFQCDASALRLTVATTPAQEPVTANHGGAACDPQEAGGTLPATPAGITGGAVYARTNLTGTEPLSQVATASAGIGELSVARPAARPPDPAAPGRQRDRAAGHRVRRSRPGPRRAVGALAADRAQGPDRGRERELPGRHAGRERRLAHRLALAARHDALDQRGRRSRLHAGLADRRPVPDRHREGPGARRRGPGHPPGHAPARARHAPRRRGAGGDAARPHGAGRADRQRRPAHPQRAARQRRARRRAGPRRRGRPGDRRRDRRELRLDRRGRARPHPDEGRLHDPQADADRRRHQGRQGLPAGRRRPAPVRRQDRCDPLALGQAHGRPSQGPEIRALHHATSSCRPPRCATPTPRATARTSARRSRWRSSSSGG